MTIKKIGFACKWIDHAGQVDGIKPKDDAKKYNHTQIIKLLEKKIVI